MTAPDHVVILVADIEAGIRTWENLGFTLSHSVDLTDAGLANAFFILDDGTFIELIAPTTEESAYAPILEEQGEGLRLLSLRVDDLDTAVAALLEKRVALRGVGTPRVFIEPTSASGPLIQLWPKDRPHRWRELLSETHNSPRREREPDVVPPF